MTVLDVVLRASLGTNVEGVIEITSFLIGFGALLSMPVCYEMRNHVCAKLLSEMNPARFARPLGLLGAVCSVLFAALMVWVLVENASSKIGSPETSRDLGLSMVWLLWIVAGTLVVALCSALIGLWREIKGEIGGWAKVCCWAAQGFWPPSC